MGYGTASGQGKECALKQAARNGSDLIFPGFLDLGAAGGIAAKAHDVGRLIIVIREGHVQMLGVEIFPSLQMHSSYESQWFLTIQDQISALIPSSKELRRHAFFKRLAGVVPENICDASADYSPPESDWVDGFPFEDHDVP